MTPTQQQIETLARFFAVCKDGEDENWEDYTCSEPIVTRDPLDHFRMAAKQTWAEASGREEGVGCVYWSNVQARKGSPRVAMAVLDCGDFRLSYSQ